MSRILALGYFVTTVSALVTLTGASLQLDDVHYFVPPFFQCHAYQGTRFKNNRQGHFGLIPVTILSDLDEDFGALSREWTDKDDVWQPGFLDTILLAGSNGRHRVNSSRRPEILPLSKGCELPPGPYFLDTSTGNVHQAYRLYDDFAGAFSQSILQTPEGAFMPLSAQIPSSAALTIGVPSRLYSKPTRDRPLAGVRIGVKDIYALAGVKQSNGNRAWYGLYPPAERTASTIQNLIDAGAIIVGLQKASQFANGETPTADWVDYHAPFNPRGDGYQDASSSSAGAGASIASYDWLDIAVGSDTGGSIRGPAGVQGLFGNRPSHGLVSLDNVMPLSPSLDTAGFLVRDPYLWDLASAAMYGENYTSYGDSEPTYPRKLYILDFPKINSLASRIQRRFASSLASFLNATATVLDLEEEWQASGPAEANGTSITELLNLTYTTLITKDQTRLLRDTFFTDYASAHDGRLPFVDPVVQARWSWGDAQPEDSATEALANKTLFMNWFNEKILPLDHNPLTCSSAILLHTDSTGYLSARNRYRDPPGLPLGFSNGEISVFTEAPDSVFPIGQIASFSSITNHTEYLPVTVDVMAAKGCDGLIAKLAQELVAEGIITIPQVGAGLEGGEILL